MQSLFLKPSAKTEGKRLNRILTDHGISAPSPYRKSYKCVIEPIQNCFKRERAIKSSTDNSLPIYQKYSFYDGNCSMGTKGIYSHSDKLLLFLESATQKYQLTDHDALFLLQFFKSNVVEACRQLCDGNSTSKSQLCLTVDAPWRLLTKTICQQPGIEQFSIHTFFQHYNGNTFSQSQRMLRSIVLQEAFLVAARGCSLHVQRAFYCGHAVQVACILAGEKTPFQVIGFQLPSAINAADPEFYNLLNELEQYVNYLVSSSIMSSSTRAELDLRDGDPQWQIAAMSLNGNNTSKINPPRLADVKYIYSILKYNCKHRQKQTA